MTMTTPRACILRTDGTNCDEETARAFRVEGAEAPLVHINQLRSRAHRLRDFQILMISGGFSYGDDVASGRVLANELLTHLREDLLEFLAGQGNQIIGICNGFQVLKRAGLLPFNTLGKMQSTLAHNVDTPFACRPTWVVTEKSPSTCFTDIEPGTVFETQSAHGEGRVWADNETLARIESAGLVPIRYADTDGKPTMEYPRNPNGSRNAIAGLCDPSGRITGLMPHPERVYDVTQHPNWRRHKISEPFGPRFFRNAVASARSAA